MPSLAEPNVSLARRLEPAGRRCRRATKVRTGAPPERWSGDWVGVRLIEAFAVLARLSGPVIDRPKGLGSIWPTVVPECSALVDQREMRARIWRQWHRPTPPSPAEVSRMEEALGWLGMHLADPRERQAVMVWSLLRAARLSIRTAERLDLMPFGRAQLYRLRDAACLRLALALAATGVAVR